jgi:hypothetical protein
MIIMGTNKNWSQFCKVKASTPKPTTARMHKWLENNPTIMDMEIARLRLNESIVNATNLETDDISEALTLLHIKITAHHASTR